MNRIVICLWMFGIFVSAATAEPIPVPVQQLYAPTPWPDRIVLTWTGDPTNSQAVTWRTDTSVLLPKAEFAEAEARPPGQTRIDPNKPRPIPVTTVAADSQYLKTDLGEAVYHSAEFTGLRPGTKYVYRVGDGANWSEWQHFRTASDQPEPFGFLYFGDAQVDIRGNWSRVVRGAFADLPQAKFLIHAGDLVNTGSSDQEWGEWHAAAGWINSTVNCVPVPGNHEYHNAPPPNADAIGPYKPHSGLTRHWRKQFALPKHGPAGLEESAFSFDYQGVRIVCLNSNERIEAQNEWLERVLANNPCRWTILTFHHPVYSPAKGRDNANLRNRWRPIIDKYGVDLVLTGHDHTYARSGLMREDVELTGDRLLKEHGTVYAVSVSGPKLYPLDDSAKWMRTKIQDTQLYQLIQMNGDRLNYQARKADGEVFDEFELRKNSSDVASQLVEKDQLETERRYVASPSRQQLLFATAALLLLPMVYGVYRMTRPAVPTS